MSAVLWRSKDPVDYKVVLGIHTERGLEASRQDRNLVRIEMGPNSADIALLKLATWVLVENKQLKNYKIPTSEGKGFFFMSICYHCGIIRMDTSLEINEKPHNDNTYLWFAAQRW